MSGSAKAPYNHLHNFVVRFGKYTCDLEIVFGEFIMMPAPAFISREFHDILTIISNRNKKSAVIRDLVQMRTVECLKTKRYDEA